MITFDPFTPILNSTIQVLRNTSHPDRKVIVDASGNKIKATDEVNCLYHSQRRQSVFPDRKLFPKQEGYSSQRLQKIKFKKAQYTTIEMLIKEKR